MSNYRLFKLPEDASGGYLGYEELGLESKGGIRYARRYSLTCWDNSPAHAHWAIAHFDGHEFAWFGPTQRGKQLERAYLKLKAEVKL